MGKLGQIGFTKYLELWISVFLKSYNLSTKKPEIAIAAYFDNLKKN